MIELEGVYKVYGPSADEAHSRLTKGQSRDDIRNATGNVVALDNVSLRIEPGEILVVMGLSGSGKSTLLRCMNLLVRPEKGRVWIEHEGKRVDLMQVDDERLRKIRQTRMAMVFQSRSLFPWRTVRENVAFGLEIRGDSESTLRKTVDEKLDLVGLGDWKDKSLGELSGGMQQRVGIARALAMNTDIMLLDEPFSGLDPILR
jgi:glycine betaine/proline transport system ATP-binding protein